MGGKSSDKNLSHVDPPVDRYRTLQQTNGVDSKNKGFFFFLLVRCSFYFLLSRRSVGNVQTSHVCVDGEFSVDMLSLDGDASTRGDLRSLFGECADGMRGGALWHFGSTKRIFVGQLIWDVVLVRIYLS